MFCLHSLSFLQRKHLYVYTYIVQSRTPLYEVTFCGVLTPDKCTFDIRSPRKTVNYSVAVQYSNKTENTLRRDRVTKSRYIETCS